MDYGERCRTWFTSFYFSIVTYTTLGFGDVKPATLIGEIIVSTEVISDTPHWACCWLCWRKNWRAGAKNLARSPAGSDRVFRALDTPATGRAGWRAVTRLKKGRF
jgi:Ion channel